MAELASRAGVLGCSSSRGGVAGRMKAQVVSKRLWRNSVSGINTALGRWLFLSMICVYPSDALAISGQLMKLDT